MSKVKTPKIEELFDAGVHFGHLVKRWHPKMEPYIFASRKNIHIINLEETDKKLKEACEFLYEKASDGEQVVFVGTKRQAKEIIVSEAKRCGAKYVTDRWLGGTITNFKVIKKNIDKLLDMTKKRDAGEYQKYTKKERLMIDREIEKLENSVGGIVGLTNIPGAIFIIDTRREKTALREAQVAKVPVAAVVDTNCDPSIVDHPIPGNDDAIKSIAILVKAAADAVEQGYKDFDTKKKKRAAEAAKKVKEEAEAAAKAEKEAKELEDSEKVIKVTGDLDLEEDIEKIVEAEEEAKEDLEKNKTGSSDKEEDVDLSDSEAKAKKLDELRNKLVELRKERDGITLEKGLIAQDNKDLRENAAYDDLAQKEDALTARILNITEQIEKISGKKEKSPKTGSKKETKQSAEKKASKQTKKSSGKKSKK